MRKAVFLLLAVLALAVGAAAQTQVSGTVVSAPDDEPVIGATVRVEGTNVTTVTDIDGNYRLTAPAGAQSILFTYVGMKPVKEPVRQVVNVTMHHDVKSLDEVMVVAYGTAKKSSFTGSATVIDASVIEQTQANNALNALTGKVSGVQINNKSGELGAANPEIRIRGISSINASNKPLVVLDGAPYSGDVNSINPSDIESMTILKDAASNALYGARGANGVILITTKKGSKGEARVTFDASWGSNAKSTSDYETINDYAAYYETFALAYYNYAVGNNNNDPLGFVNRNVIKQLGGYNVFSVPEGQNMFVEGVRLNPEATLGNIVTNADGQKFLLIPDNWKNAAYKHGFRQDYNFSVSKAGDNSNFYASFGYLDNEGIVDNTNYKRLTGRLSADIMAKSWLKIGANMSYTHSKGSNMNAQEAGNDRSTGNIFAITNQIAPIYPLYMRDEKGGFVYDKWGMPLYDYGGEVGGHPTYGAGFERPCLGGSNAVQQQQLDGNSYTTNSVVGNGFIEVRFLRDFKFTSNNSFSYRNERLKSSVNPYYGQYANMNGILSVESDGYLDYQFQQLLNWNRNFGLHSVGVLLGHENYWQKSDVLYGAASNGIIPQFAELSGYVTQNGKPNSYLVDYNTEGYFGRVNYEYDNRYFASASFRRDGSSRFHPDHRWGNFWSIGAAWMLSKEKFMEPYEWVNELKVKLSYGEQGNDGIGDFRYQNTYKVVNSNGTPSVQPDILGNKDITWEKGGNLNYGVEFGLFDNRLTGDIEGFWRKTSDMLFSFPLPPSYGYTSYYANVGDMTNTGFELNLDGTIIDTRDITWSVNANLTYYKNKITMLPDERKTMSIVDITSGKEVGGYSSTNYFYGEGLPIYSFYMKSYAGVDENGHAQYWADVQEDGVKVRKAVNYNEADYYVCGSALPKVYGGFGTSLNAYGFDLAVAFTYQIGGKVYDSDYQSLMTAPSQSHRGYAIHVDALGSWTPENPDGASPRWWYNEGYDGNSSDRWLVSASCITLQNVNLGYSIPSKILSKIGIERVRLYLNCDNLYTWSKRKGMDPRQSVSGATTNAYYAPMRTISGGINVSF